MKSKAAPVFATVKEDADSKYSPLHGKQVQVKKKGKFKTVCIIFGYESSIPTDQLIFN